MTGNAEEIEVTNRLIIPLHVLRVADTPLGATRIQKTAFLLQKETSLPELYDFHALDYGPMSPQLDYELDRLEKEGYLRHGVFGDNSNSQRYTLTDKAMSVLDSQHQSLQNTTPVIEYYNKEGLWDLLDYVHSEYPSFATESRLNCFRRPSTPTQYSQIS